MCETSLLKNVESAFHVAIRNLLLSIGCAGYMIVGTSHCKTVISDAHNSIRLSPIPSREVLRSNLSFSVKL